MVYFYQEDFSAIRFWDLISVFVNTPLTLLSYLISSLQFQPNCPSFKIDLHVLVIFNHKSHQRIPCFFIDDSIYIVSTCFSELVYTSCSKLDLHHGRCSVNSTWHSFNKHTNYEPNEKLNQRGKSKIKSLDNCVTENRGDKLSPITTIYYTMVMFQFKVKTKLSAKMK